MKDSNLEAVWPYVERCDMEQFKRIAPQIEDLMKSEPMTVATGIFLVGSIAGWFASTLETAEEQTIFERLIEMQFDAASERRQQESKS